jgi:hypothetical protein
VGVYDAAWTLVAWNPTWAALMGDPSASAGRDRNLLWRHFTGTAGRVVRSPAEITEFELSAAADIRAAAGRYPDDAGLHRLIADLRQVSSRFAEAWQQHGVGARRSDRKTIAHPEVGPLTLDCDVLTVGGSDLRIIVHTADPASDDAGKLSLIRTIGLQGVGSDPSRW